jgi:hypothetical protein
MHSIAHSMEWEHTEKTVLCPALNCSIARQKGPEKKGKTKEKPSWPESIRVHQAMAHAHRT